MCGDVIPQWLAVAGFAVLGIAAIIAVIELLTIR